MQKQVLFDYDNLFVVAFKLSAYDSNSEVKSKNFVSV